MSTDTTIPSAAREEEKPAIIEPNNKAIGGLGPEISTWVPEKSEVLMPMMKAPKRLDKIP